MVFVRKVPGRPGATKVQIAERKGGRDVVLEHVGTARSEEELAALLEVARRKINPGQDELDLGLARQGEGSLTAPAVITGKRSAVLWQVLTGVYAHLGFEAIGDETFKQLVLARLIEPTSNPSRATGVCHACRRSRAQSGLRSAFRRARSAKSPFSTDSEPKILARDSALLSEIG